MLTLDIITIITDTDIHVIRATVDTVIAIVAAALVVSVLGLYFIR